MVVVAQLVEPRIVIPVVAGSSPVDHPTFSFDFGALSEFVVRSDQPSYSECNRWKAASNTSFAIRFY